MIVALDVATVTGVAIGDPGATPVCYSVDFSEAGESVDARLAQALRFGLKLFRETAPDIVAFEAPFLRRRDSVHRLQLLMGLPAVLRAAAVARGAKVESYAVSTIDKAFIGQRMSGRDARKAALLQACRLRGWHVPDQDSADAAAVWETACAHAWKNGRKK